MPELWYESSSDTRDMAARERALPSHGGWIGLVVLVVALVVMALLFSR